MQITVNGRREEVAAGISVLTLLNNYKLNPAITIVEKNQVILSRESYAMEILKTDDTLELIRYMGGG